MRGPNYIRVNSISAEGQDSTCPKQFMAFVTVRGWVEEKGCSPAYWEQKHEDLLGHGHLDFLSSETWTEVWRGRIRPVPRLGAVHGWCAIGPHGPTIGTPLPEKQPWYLSFYLLFNTICCDNLIKHYKRFFFSACLHVTVSTTERTKTWTQRKSSEAKSSLRKCCNGNKSRNCQTCRKSLLFQIHWRRWNHSKAEPDC